ncbi:YbjQ family protein [Roseimarinus sediminis]|uniref:YbjQ family protein n=1 Tax=Roseimarinus sediminis TaxID=1610899 RepID=UPI003D1FAF85
MKDKIIVTTTNSIEGASIINYLELISINVVVGTNIFSDLGASFVDLFGGKSSSYQNKLQGIYKAALDKLKAKANDLGANAIIGLKIDFDEISGKGKSMFMISAFGTAVKIIQEINPNSIITDSQAPITSETLKSEVTRRLIIKKVTEDKLPNEKDWEYLFNSPIIEISDKLLTTYISYSKSSETVFHKDEKLLMGNISEYFKT